jgi:hypothetical protein
MLKMSLVLIWFFGIPRNCLNKNPMFRDWDYCIFHQARGLFKSSSETKIWQNKNNSDFNKPSLVFLHKCWFTKQCVIENKWIWRKCWRWSRLKDLKITIKSGTKFFCRTSPLKLKLYPSQLGLPHNLSPYI